MKRIKNDVPHKIAIILPYLLMVSLSFILLFTLISKHEFWSGYDTYFHMNGIYEAAMQIRTDHYSYFLSLFGFEQSGRIVNALYGPMLNYLFGAILLICGTWIRFEFVIFFITLIICGSAMYSCAQGLNIPKGTATLLAMFYMISQPVLILWIRNFEFTGLGAAVLLPFVFMLGIKILRNRRIEVIPLAVIMAICLQIHLMTSLIAALVLVPFIICGLVLSGHRFQMIKRGVLATILLICLSGNVLGAIYDVCFTNHLIPTFPNFNLQRPIINKVLFFQGHCIIGLGTFYTLLIVIVVVATFLRFQKATIIDWCLLLEDVLFLWMSSAYFPWEFLLKRFPDLASIIQFPVRFMAIVFITTLLLVGRIISTLLVGPKVVVSVALAVAFVIMLHSAFAVTHQESQNWRSNNAIQYWVRPVHDGGFSHNFHNGPKIRAAMRSHDLSAGINVVHKITTDYMPTPQRVNLKTYYRNPFNQEYIKAFHNQRRFHKIPQGHGMSMTWRNSKQQMMPIPLVKYSRTFVKLDHRVIHPKRTLIGTIFIRAKPGMNRLQIEYRPSKMFKVLSTVSVFSWLLLLGLWIFRKMI